MRKNKKPTRFFSVIWREGKYYVAQCIPVDVSSFGRTKDEALKNLREALELYFEDHPWRVLDIQAPSIEVGEFTHA